MEKKKIERLLFVEGYSVQEAAEHLGVTSKELRKKLQEWGLEAELRLRGLRSEPQLKLLRVVRELYPNTEIKSEHPIGERLALDIYLPRYRIAFEYDGRQHDHFVEFFHKDEEGFERAQKRDQEKERICYALGIVLVRIKAGEEITADNVMRKAKEALISNGEGIEPELPYKERLKRLSRDAKRARMRAMYDFAKKLKKQGGQLDDTR